MGGVSQAFDRMGGAKGAAKKMFLNTAAPLSKQNLAMNRKESRVVLKPAPPTDEELAAGKPRGATMVDDPAVAEEARRRRAARRMPAATMLSSDSQSLGG